MKNREQIVREQVYTLRGRTGRPKELSLLCWLAAKAEFNRTDDQVWATETVATTRRSRSLLEDNPASG